jgi:hypothetical protein
MDQLWALKKEFDPFRWSRFGPGAGQLLAVLRCTFFLCPYCRWLFKITWRPSVSLLGNGQRKCWHCKRVFWDGSSEWSEMNGKEQRLFLLPITVLGYLGAFLVILGIVLWESASSEESLPFNYILFFSVFLPPLLFWFAFRAWQISRSIRRYNERGAKVTS